LALGLNVSALSMHLQLTLATPSKEEVVGKVDVAESTQMHKPE
jgi:hypothetical protein